MMGTITKAFIKTISLWRSDKVIMLLSLIPILIGLILFYFMGTYLYGDLVEWARTWMESKIDSKSLIKIFYYLFLLIISLGLYFIISWTFVLVVSILASPFQDLISLRVEKNILGKEQNPMMEDVQGMLTKFFSTIFNEAKKISLIIILSLLVFLLGLIPILVPVAIILSAFILSWEFLDYSWSRREYKFSECLKSQRKHIFTYSLSGMIFMIFFSIPILNLLAMPFAVIYFTILFSQFEVKGTNTVSS